MLIDKLLGAFAPHICKGCGMAGDGLCPGCFSDIVDSTYDRCVHCSELANDTNLCQTCRAELPFDRAFVVGARHGSLYRLIGDFKFNSERGQAKVIAGLLDATLPILPSNIVIMPIPTIPPHIRQRGFGHTELVAKNFARKRHHKYNAKLLSRVTNSVQHGLSADERQRQAKRTFAVNKSQPIPEEILLIDDIYTTGSTAISAAKLLKQAGVKTVNLAIIGRHINQ